MFSFKRIYFIVLAIVILVTLFPPYFIEVFELNVYDLMIRYSAPNKPDPRVVIVGIDQKSLDKYGRWPWHRETISKLIDKLSGFDVKVTALDMIFSSSADLENAKVLNRLEDQLAESDVLGSPGLQQALDEAYINMSGDQALADSITRSGNTITGYVFHGGDIDKSSNNALQNEKDMLVEKYRIKKIRTKDSNRSKIWFTVSSVEPNTRIVQEAPVTAGFLNAWADDDGIIRSSQMVIEYKGSIYPSLALSMAAEYLSSHKDLQVSFAEDGLEGVFIKDQFLALDNFGRLNIRFLGKDGTFQTISAMDVLEKPLTDPELSELLKNKIALVGATATQIYDVWVTPFGYTTGVEIMANSVSMALTGSGVKKYTWLRMFDAMLILLIGIVLFFVLQRNRIYVGILVSFFIIIGLFLGSYYMISQLQIWVNPMVTSLMTVAGFIIINTGQYIEERKSKNYIMRAFSRFVAPKVVDTLIKDPSLLKLRGDKREMTAFFSDIIRFVTISEKLAIDDLMKLINAYLTEMTKIIHELDGTIDKYKGDEIVAFYGAPVPIEDHAERAVLGAVRQQRRLAEMRTDLNMKGAKRLHVKMGINSGKMIVGNIGSDDRLDYTILGDEANIASRLETLNKFYGTRIIISGNTYKHVKDKFLCREMDKVRVYGKSKILRIYEVMEEMDRATDYQHNLTILFGEALATFRRKHFKGALELFSNIDKVSEGNDSVAKLYMERCAKLMRSSPPDEWDMSYDLTKK